AAVCSAGGPHIGDHPVGDHGDAELLGEPKVVLHQRVLGPVAAADHAAAATNAAAPPGPLAAEVRVLDLLAGLAEKSTDPGRLERVADPDLLAVFPQQLVGRSHALV